MAELEPLTPERTRPSPGQIRRRRLVALTALVVFVVLVVVAVAVAIPRVHHHKALPPPPPPPHQYRIVFPEGFTRAQMIVRVHDVARIAQRKTKARVRLSAAAYAKATRRAVIPCFKPKAQHNLEGFLFPSTYNFEARSRSSHVVHDQLQAFCQNWQSVDLSYAKTKNLTPYDVLTIASMVEKEAQVPSERPLIAAVIYNRLHNRMPLGIDATLRYGLHIAPTQSILQSQLDSNNPYNSRKLPGLPPTPIANPGLASIRAAAHPATVDYLYFVRKPDKVHHFFTASDTAFAQYECAHGYGC